MRAIARVTVRVTVRAIASVTVKMIVRVMARVMPGASERLPHGPVPLAVTLHVSA